MNSALSTSSSPAYHRLYRDPHAQSRESNEFDNNHRVGAEQLYQLITNSYTERNVPLQNISAFCSDSCSVMMGANNSVAQPFRRDNTNIIIVKCPSHSIHLCAENAMKELPGDIVKMCS